MHLFKFYNVRNDVFGACLTNKKQLRLSQSDKHFHLGPTSIGKWCLRSAHQSSGPHTTQQGMGAGCSRVNNAISPGASKVAHGTQLHEKEIFTGLSELDVRQQLAGVCQEMKAMKVLMEKQQFLILQLSSERNRASDLEEEVRDLKIKETQSLLKGSGRPLESVGQLHGLDQLQELPALGSSRSSRSSGKSSREGGVLRPHDGHPTLYKASWKQMALFKSLSDSNMNSIIKKMTVRSFTDGETIVKQGTIGTTMFFIDLGSAKAVVGETIAQVLISGRYALNAFDRVIVSFRSSLLIRLRLS